MSEEEMAERIFQLEKRLNKIIHKLKEWRKELQEEGTTQYWTEDISEKITKLLEEKQ